MRVFRVEQAGVEPGFVAEKEKSLRIGIETPERVNIFWESKLSQGAVGGAIWGKLGNHPIGFVKGEEHSEGDSIDFISGVRPKKRPPYTCYNCNSYRLSQGLGWFELGWVEA
jgi:hypothetical protein